MNYTKLWRWTRVSDCFVTTVLVNYEKTAKMKATKLKKNKHAQAF